VPGRAFETQLSLDTGSAGGVVCIIAQQGSTTYRSAGQRKLRKALAIVAGAFCARILGPYQTAWTPVSTMPDAGPALGAASNMKESVNS
jgi:hypothetical protein